MKSLKSDRTRAVVIKEDSQEDVLQMEMQKANLTHGQTVIANLPNVRLLTDSRGVLQLYFCHMGQIKVVRNIKRGDGGKVPGLVKFPQGLKADFAGDGYYDLKKVRLTSNGTTQINATAETTWEKIKQPA